MGYVNKEDAVVFDNAGRRVILTGKQAGVAVVVARRVQQGVEEDYLGR